MRKPRAVVIDDEEIVVHLIKNYLCARNYEVLSYTRPVICPILDEKGNHCNSDYPCADIVITDFRMPGMNGLELLQAQSKHGCKLTRENKAVMSGHIDQESYMQIKRLGHAFFQKPIDFSHFSAWLDKCEKKVDLSGPLGSRRRETRHATHYEVRCLVDHANEHVNGTTINISDGGLCLKLTAPLLTRQTIHIDTAHPIIACRIASVKWVIENQDGSYLAGLSCH